MDPYLIIIFLALIVVVSSFYSYIAKHTNIPSVLLLILTGVGLQLWLKEDYLASQEETIFSVLKLLGNVGLVMIVLEAALDLKLTSEKKSMVITSFFVALISIALCIVSIGFIIYFFIDNQNDLYHSFVNAVPLSIISSAIVIPSLGGLRGGKKEYMIYEATFSDILGIMIFYFMTQHDVDDTASVIAIDIVKNFSITIIVSIILAYLLVFMVQKIHIEVKLFLIIAILLFMFSLGKLMHFSSLLLILLFGLMMNNTRLFFKGKLKQFCDREVVGPVLKDFHIITLESSFVIRTFFFVVFGFFITLSDLVDWRVAVLGFVIVAVFLLLRFIVLKVFIKRNLFPITWIAPRGLITILLFFVIPEQYKIAGVNNGLLLYVINFSALFMAIALVKHKGTKARELLPKIDFTEEPDKLEEDESVKGTF